MKLKLTRPDGTVLEVEGTVEECAAVAGLASLDLGSVPAQSVFHYHYHDHRDVSVSHPWTIGWPFPNNTPQPWQPGDGITFTLNTGHQALLLEGHVVDGEVLGGTVNGN